MTGDVATALITGASRGIGLALATKLLGAGWRVIATARDPANSPELLALAKGHPERCVVRALDVADFAAIDALASAGEGVGDEAIDLLVNNAAIMGPDYGEQAFGASDFDAWLEVLRVNGLAPMKMMEAFADAVARSERKQIVNVSSIMGSCGKPRFGGIYSYRSSKTLLNGITATAACDLGPRGITVVAIHPGYVRTALGSPVAEDTPEMAVDALWPVLEGLGPEHNGQFLNCDGEAYPW